MKADISKEERRRLEREQEAEIRAALVPHHVAALFVMGGELAEQVVTAIAARAAAPVPVPVVAPVVSPEPEPEPEPEPVAPQPMVTERRTPDLAFGLRERLGLR